MPLVNKNHVDFKVVMLGKEYSGKSSIVHRLLANEYNGHMYKNTIGAHYGSKDFTFNLRKVSIFNLTIYIQNLCIIFLLITVCLCVCRFVCHAF